MAKSKRKKQEKLSAKRSRKALKRKAARAGSSRQQSVGQLLPVANYPVHETLITETLFEIGQGTVIFSRIFPDGNVALSLFLVDIFCLGVKDADYTIISMQKYHDFLARTEQHGRLIEIEPECLVKLVFESVNYAMSFGFSPHKDYRKAKTLFGAITGDECDRTFEFGKDGKPFYIAGPYDTPAKTEQIMRQLERAVGPDGFLFMHPIDEHDLNEDVLTYLGSD